MNGVRAHRTISGGSNIPSLNRARNSRVIDVSIWASVIRPCFDRVGEIRIDAAAIEVRPGLHALAPPPPAAVGTTLWRR